MDNKLYKEAILDAKAVRASAIATAKATLQEAIEPKIQEMMRLKLSEEFEEGIDEAIEEDDTYEEGIEEGDTYEEGIEEEGMHQTEEGVEEVTDATLEEILAELDALEEDQSLNEAEEDEEAEDEDEEESEIEADEDESEEGAAGVEDDTKVIDITLGDLKQVLQSVMGADQSMDLGGLEDEAGAGAGEESEESPVSLDEILAELEKEGYEEGKEEVEEGKKDEEKEKMEEELELAKETIATLRESINEINLLNAKLLYMNKIFKSKSLTESEKIKVIKAFDRNASVKEVKNTYETLKESLSVKKSTIKESVGFASKPIGVAPKSNIIESNDFVSRWQKIAGIK